MRRLAQLCAVAVALVTAPLASESGGLLEDLRFPPIQFRPPAIERQTILNDQVLMLRAPETSLPFFTLTLNFEGGLDRETIEDAGLLDATLQLLEEGGAGELSGAQRSALLGRMGASLGFQSGYSGWSVSLRFLKRDYPEAMRLLREALLSPRLPEEDLQTVQRNLRTAIERRNDRPEQIGARKMNELLYPGLRRGYTLQIADVDRLDVASINAELKRRLDRRGLVAIATGDIGDLPLESDLQTLLSELPASGPRPAAEPGGRSTLLSRRPNPDPYRGRILLIDSPAAQAVIQVAAYLPEHSAPQFFALQTGNFILGGGSFNSRLMREIRVQRGLAYYAYSYNDFNRLDGEFNAGSATRVAQAPETLQLMLQMIPNLQRGVEAQELQLAKDSILNGFAFQFSTPEESASNELRFYRNGLPADHLARFPERIRAVSSAEIAQAAALLSDPNLFVVVVGPGEMKSELEKIRPVIVAGPEDALYPPPRR